MNRVAPSLAEIESLAEEAFASIPEKLRKPSQGVAIVVLEFPPDEVITDMGYDSPFELLGLYQGTALTHKSHADTPSEPDLVFLYRRPILDYWCESGEDLGHIVRHVLIHEIGHHFGFSDADMEEIERQASGE